MTQPAMVIGITGIESRLEDLFSAGDTEGILKLAFQVGVEFIRNPDLIGRALFCPVLDNALERISSAISSGSGQAANADNIVHVATEVYEVGGHTRILEDIVRAFPEKKHTLILTDIFGQYAAGVLNRDGLRKRFDSLHMRVICLKQTESLLARMRELITLIGSIAPRVIFINAHHYDSVAYGGISGNSAPRVHFLHHTDYQPSLGASRVDYEHIDFSPLAHPYCRARPDLHPKMLHITASDAGIMSIDWRAPMAGVTCGTSHKYRGKDPFSYGEILASLFAAGVEKMYHIGDMPDEQGAQIRNDIKMHGQDDNRVIFLGFSASMTERIKQLPVQFYLNSFPMGGGKAIADALSLGLPIIDIGSKGSLIRCDMSSGAALMFDTLTDVHRVVDQIRSDGQRLAALSRQTYEKSYTPLRFREALMTAIENS